MDDDVTRCARCGDEPAGPGGILGARCEAEIMAMTTEDWYGAAEPA